MARRPAHRPHKPKYQTPGLFDDLPADDGGSCAAIPDDHSRTDWVPCPSGHPTPIAPQQSASSEVSAGQKAKARDILAALRVVNAVERESRPATADEQATLARFPGFGAVALSLFPDPLRDTYKDDGWRQLGEELFASRPTPSSGRARPSSPTS